MDGKRGLVPNVAFRGASLSPTWLSVAALSPTWLSVPHWARSGHVTPFSRQKSIWCPMRSGKPRWGQGGTRKATLGTRRHHGKPRWGQGLSRVLPSILPQHGQGVQRASWGCDEGGVWCGVGCGVSWAPTPTALAMPHNMVAASCKVHMLNGTLWIPCKGCM